LYILDNVRSLLWLYTTVAAVNYSFRTLERFRFCCRWYQAIQGWRYQVWCVNRPL